MPKLNELLSLYSLNREVVSIGAPGSSDFVIRLDNNVTITIEYNVAPPVEEDYVEVAEFAYPNKKVPSYYESRRVVVNAEDLTYKHLSGFDLDRQAPRKFFRDKIRNLRFVSVPKSSLNN